MRSYISIADVPAGTPDAFLNDGALFLDLPLENPFRVTERLEEVNDLDKMQTSGVLDFDIPMTDKNKFVFAEYLSPNAEDRSFDPLDVLCMAEGHDALLFDKLYFKGSRENVEDPTNKAIAVSLVYGDDFWLTQMQKLKLNTLDLGNFLLNEANHFANWLNHIYGPGQDKFWFPLVHMGAWWREQDQFVGVVPEDFLPWLSLQGVLEAGFQKVGWTFTTPLSDAEWWNTIWLYLLGEIKYENRGSYYIFQGETDEQILIDQTGVLPYLYFEANLVDPSGSHEIVVGDGPDPGKRSYYNNLTEIESEFTITLTGQVINFYPHPIRFDMIAWNNDTNSSLGGVSNIRLEGAETKTISLTFTATADYANRFAIRVVALQGIGDDPLAAIIIPAGFSIDLTPSSNRLYRNDTIPIAELVNPDYLFIDFLKGVTQLGSFKFHTDWNTRTVGMYPIVESDVYESIVNGFFRPTAQALDITTQIVQNSRGIQVQEKEQSRFWSLKFKGNGDPYIVERLQIPKETPLYGRDIDLGRGSEVGTKKIENSFFEPTGDIVWNNLSIPAVWDENALEGRRTVLAGPRLMMAVGWVEQGDIEQVPASPVNWTYSYQVQTKIPWGSQLPKRAYDPGDGQVLPTRSLVYGGGLVGVDDLYEMFWAEDFRTRLYSRTFEFIMFVDVDWYSKLDFRTRLHLHYDEDTAIYRLLEKADYPGGSNVTMIVRMRAEPSKKKTKR